MPGYVDISPGGNHYGWIGNEPPWSGGSNTGAWLKKVAIGGSSLASAKIVADSAGNVTIDGNAIISGSLHVAQLTGWGGATLDVTGGITFTVAGSNTVITGNQVACGFVVAVSVSASQFSTPLGGNGIFGTRTVVDGGGVSHTVTISGGIITGWT